MNFYFKTHGQKTVRHGKRIRKTKKIIKSVVHANLQEIVENVLLAVLNVALAGIALLAALNVALAGTALLAALNAVLAGIALLAALNVALAGTVLLVALNVALAGTALLAALNAVLAGTALLVVLVVALAGNVAPHVIAIDSKEKLRLIFIRTGNGTSDHLGNIKQEQFQVIDL